MYLTLIHVAGGSAVDEASPAATVGPYATAQEAEDAGETVLRAVRHVDFLEQEGFFTVVELPDPPHDPHTAITALLETWGDDADDDAADGIEVATISVQDLLG